MIAKQTIKFMFHLYHRDKIEVGALANWLEEKAKLETPKLLHLNQGHSLTEYDYNGYTNQPS